MTNTSLPRLARTLPAGSGVALKSRLRLYSLSWSLFGMVLLTPQGAVRVPRLPDKEADHDDGDRDEDGHVRGIALLHGGGFAAASANTGHRCGLLSESSWRSAARHSGYRAAAPTSRGILNPKCTRSRRSRTGVLQRRAWRSRASSLSSAPFRSCRSFRSLPPT